MTQQDLQYRQALPLDDKIALTKARIREWVRWFGVDGVYISFSGGKDSTVLLHIAREMYPNIPAVFADTGLEYPELREFVKSWDNVEWIKPDMNFKQVIKKYGYPFISKEVAQRLFYAKKFIEKNGRDCPDSQKPTSLLALEGKLEGKNIKFNCQNYEFLLDAPYLFGATCCDVMKKKPFRKYAKNTGRTCMTAIMACESALRRGNYLRNGCNAFDLKEPQSNPMSFWMEKDVLEYICRYNLKIASVYGEIEQDEKGIRTTGLSRTGCMFCGFGAHLEKGSVRRFRQMSITHPKQHQYIMKPWDEGGLDYFNVIDWINWHSDIHIFMGKTTWK